MTRGHPNTRPFLAELLEDALFDVVEKPIDAEGGSPVPTDWWELHEPDEGHLVGRAVVTRQDGIDVYAFVGGDVARCAWYVHLSPLTPDGVILHVLEGVFAFASAQLSQ